MITVNTSEYILVHGKSPRGMGSWFFSNTRHELGKSHSLWVNGLTYGEAKKKAIAWARKNGYTEICVGA